MPSRSSARPVCRNERRVTDVEHDPELRRGGRPERGQPPDDAALLVDHEDRPHAPACRRDALAHACPAVAELVREQHEPRVAPQHRPGQQGVAADDADDDGAGRHDGRRRGKGRGHEHGAGGSRRTGGREPGIG